MPFSAEMSETESDRETLTRPPTLPDAPSMEEDSGISCNVSLDSEQASPAFTQCSCSEVLLRLRKMESTFVAHFSRIHQQLSIQYQYNQLCLHDNDPVCLLPLGDGSIPRLNFIPSGSLSLGEFKKLNIHQITALLDTYFVPTLSHEHPQITLLRFLGCNRVLLGVRGPE